MSAMIAEVKDNKILVVTLNGDKTRKFQLIPYVETEDGTQQTFDTEIELDRIAVCITEFNGVPTEIIRKNFVSRTMQLVEKSKETNRHVLQILEGRENEKAIEAAKQNEKDTEDFYKLSTENQEH